MKNLTFKELSSSPIVEIVPVPVPEGTLHAIVVDDVDKIIVFRNGTWVDVTTDMPIPKGSDIKIVPMGSADRFRQKSNTVNKGHEDVENTG